MMPISLLYKVTGTTIIVLGLLISTTLPGLSSIWISILVLGMVMVLIARWLPKS
jgi:membrane-bound ClpP family serine protease